MKKTDWLRKLTSICISLLLMMTALPMHAEEVVVEPEAQAEYTEAADIVAEPVESEAPAVEAIVENEVSETPAEPEEPAYEEEYVGVGDESTAQDAQPASAQDDTNAQELLAIQQFFGVDEIAPEDEAFYRALFSYARMRGTGGMPMTIALAAGELVVFDGAKHQTTYTQGTITSQIQIPASYVVTFEAKVEGRLPGTYTPTLTSVSVMNGSMNMTAFFDIGVTGGALEITSTGSLLMIAADNYEAELTGWDISAEVTTGTAFVNWMPLSDELQLTLRSTGGNQGILGSEEMYLWSYAITVIEDGMDITQYYESVFASPGQLIITPPANKIPIVVRPPAYSQQYTGSAFTTGQPVRYSMPATISVVSINGISGNYDSIAPLMVIYTMNPREDMIACGEYTITESDWDAVYAAPREMMGSSTIEEIVAYSAYFDISVQPTTLTIYE